MQSSAKHAFSSSLCFSYSVWPVLNWVQPLGGECNILHWTQNGEQKYNWITCESGEEIWRGSVIIKWTVNPALYILLSFKCIHFYSLCCKMGNVNKGLWIYQIPTRVLIKQKMTVVLRGMPLVIQFWSPKSIFLLNNNSSCGHFKSDTRNITLFETCRLYLPSVNEIVSFRAMFSGNYIYHPL